MGTFINEVCISCLQLLKTLYVRMSLVLGKLICNMHSCMFVLDFGKNQNSKKFSYILRFWLYIDRCKESPRSSFYIVFYPEFETSFLDGSIKHNVDTRM